MSYSVSTIAMIVFFACFAILAAVGGGSAVVLIEWIAAAVAAIALALHK